MKHPFGTAGQRSRPLPHRGSRFAWLVLTLMLLLSVTAGTLFAAEASSAKASSRTVLVMGDSLSAAYGLSASQGWVTLAAQRIAREKPGWKVVNASVSGETTAGGRSRIAGELKRHRPQVLVIALGANDGLRGLPVAAMRDNLDAMTRAGQASGARVLIVGMQMPPNLGRAYTQQFAQSFAVVAKARGATLLPFLLQPIASDRAAFQDDNLHPVASAQPKLMAHVWPSLAPLLK